MESWLDREGLTFKRTRGTSGLQLNVKECPACGNSHWKVYLNAESGLGNCFVCEAKFTKWRFIEAYVGSTARETFQHIEAYMAEQGWRPRQHDHAPVVKPVLELPTSIPIPINGRNLSYLSRRNISIELARFFQLRYCHVGGFAYLDAYGRSAEQDYSRRVIIPVFDLDGQLVSFQGRDITGTAAKKYLFPPLFSATGSVLYNGNNAFKAKRLVIGEGAFDAFAIKAAIDMDPSLEDCAAVATFGKKLAPGQLEKIKRLKSEGALRKVIFMWDAEKSAITAACNAALFCRSHGIEAAVALLPKDCDPNEVDAVVVQEAIKNAADITPMKAISMMVRA